MHDQGEQIVMHKTLVTGTAGFIGYHLAKKLLMRGDEVVGIDNINDYYDVNLKYGRLKELGVERSHCEKQSDETPVIASEAWQSTKYPKPQVLQNESSRQRSHGATLQNRKVRCSL